MRLIGIDLDGTLLRGEGIEAEDLAALHEAQELGVPVILATGRSHFSAEPVAARLGLHWPHISYNGAWIKDTDGGLLRDLRVPVETAREVLRGCREVGLAVRVFADTEVIMSEVPGPDEKFFKYRPFERVDTGIADTLEVAPVQMVLVHLDDIRAFTSKFGGSHIEHDLYGLMNGRDPETPHMWALHLLNKGGTKSAALAQLCETWGINPSNVLAFGDGPNDIDMLEWAGTGVSFPWGVPEAQAAANVITNPDDPHPIATVTRAWMENKLK